ncbi:glutamyl-tRNA reductase [Thiotrichales bacterium 19S3-7]|nr:glutamyl-tRNA reductase [Thiotrichales bacterium 19S3-7]MCF6801671.1 glutamyl-tRNA reductase [Thiotrichales bacterium 19S3-11]
MHSYCLYMLGIDYNHASIAIREMLSFRKDQALVAQAELINSGLAEEVVILSTCNRTEVYVVSRYGKDHIINWWLQAKNLPVSYQEYLIYREEIDALRHLMRTASGLESMILGEPQILGQVRQSYSLALENNHILNQLAQFFEQSILAAKAIRRGTDIGKCPVSVAFSAAHLAKKHYLENLEDKSVLIIGAGDTAQLVAQHICSMKPKKMVILNRTIEKAKSLAIKVNGEYESLTKLPDLLNHVDLVISAVGVKDYIIDSQLLALLESSELNKLFIDLSVPRSIDPNLTKSKSITLYGVDNLNEIIKENKTLRHKASIYAERLIDQMLDEYSEKLRYRARVHKIKALRQSTDQLALNELQKGLKRLDKGVDPHEVLTELVHSLKNKWLHQPSISMRKAAVSGRDELLDNASELFGLDSDERS